MSKLDELSTVHDLVKSNLYRINQDDKYLNGYRKLLYKLGELFYEVIKEDKLFNSSTNMLHDFYCAIRNFGTRDHWDYVTHIERCIGVIHTYIDTKEVPYYYTYYTGMNIPKGIDRVTLYRFDYIDKEFYPEYSLHDLNIHIDYYNNQVYKSVHDYLIKLRKKLYKV